MRENVTSPLKGKRVVVTRPALQSEALAAAIQDRGAIPIWRPLIEFSKPEDFGPLDEAISALEEFDWLIFTSGEAVRAVARRCSELKRDVTPCAAKLQVAAVGPATAAAIRNARMSVDYEAQTHSGLGLAGELGERVRGKKVLLPRSDRAKLDLPEALHQFGAQVVDVVAYRTLRPTDLQKEELRKFVSGGVDAIVFFSPSAVQHFSELMVAEKMRTIQDALAITAVGPVTAKALREAGVARMVVASDTTAASVIDALEKHFAAVKAAPAGAKQA